MMHVFKNASGVTGDFYPASEYDALARENEMRREDHMAARKKVDALAAELDKVQGEYYALSQDDGKVERALESAQARIRALESAINTYTEHSSDTCLDGKCICGLDAILATLPQTGCIGTVELVCPGATGSALETACEWFCYGSGHVDAVKNTGETCRVCGNERCPTENRGGVK
jgi:hypothetical protein